MRNTVKYLVGMVIGFLWMTTSSAQMIENLAIHGFGGWTYGKTDNKNSYLMGNEEGNYDNVDFALNVTAKPYEKLSLHIQPSFMESGEESKVGLDYAFAEMLFSDMAKVRVGKVKVPFMLYTEVYKVGTIRPFFTLPQGIYHDATAEAYKGLGITGTLDVAKTWELQYDVYGGKISLQPALLRSFQDGQRFIVSSRDMIGGRLIVRPPFERICFGLSSYRGDFDVAIDGQVQEDFSAAGTSLLIGAFAEYRSDRWWIRSEYVAERENPEIREDVVYAEVAYQITSHWQVAARYEFLDLQVTAPELQYVPKSFYEHEDMAIGANYWFNPNLVIKLSYHRVDGNLFAKPDKLEDLLEALTTNNGDKTTQLVRVGVQFSF